MPTTRPSANAHSACWPRIGSERATHGLNSVATALAAFWLVADHRRRNGRCLRCGRTSAAPPPAGSRGRLWWPALVAVAGALPYGLLKLARSAGSDVGLTGGGFAEATASSPRGRGHDAPRRVLDRGLPADGCGTRDDGRALGAHGGRRRRFPHAHPRGGHSCGAARPGPVGSASIDDSEIAPWAFGLVYGSFLVRGVAFAWLTITDWHATRPHCREHSTESAVP